MNTLNYFTIQEADLFSFYRIPKELFTSEKYKHISTDAKVLYGLLLDRNSLSIKNKWVDDRGYIYIYFSRQEVMETLGFGDKTVTKIFKELKEVDLIEEKRQGLGKANIIFVKKFIVNDSESIDKSKNRKNYDSGEVKNTIQEGENLRSNNTNINNTKNNKSVSQSGHPDPDNLNREKTTDGQTDDKTIKRILENGNVELYHNRLFISQAITKLWNDKNIAYSLKMGLKHQDIQERLRLLQSRHIDLALGKMAGCKSNKEKYFQICLLTAIVEIDLDLSEESEE